MTPDTSAKRVNGLARMCEEANGFTLLDRGKEIAATLRAMLRERDELRASFDLRWKADMRAIRLRREQSQDDDNLTWPDHADLVVWLLAERDRLAADVERLLSDAARLACIVTGALPDKNTMTPEECQRVDDEAHDCAHRIMREHAARVKARAALAGEGKSSG